MGLAPTADEHARVRYAQGNWIGLEGDREVQNWGSDASGSRCLLWPHGCCHDLVEDRLRASKNFRYICLPLLSPTAHYHQTQDTTTAHPLSCHPTRWLMALLVVRLLPWCLDPSGWLRSI